jgi:uncharacterized membrane protein YhiD involved in acid resistance
MTQTLNESLLSISNNIPILNFIINIILSAILSLLLKWVYIKYGDALSNRAQFGKNFLMITMTTMFIITVVKSSLALSLGLVGALSIIRFRAAIKEPEELAYIFLAIAIGLGFGADQTQVTIVAFSMISIMVIFAKKASKKFQDNKNLHLTIQNNSNPKINLTDIIEILKKNCESVDLRRIDENNEVLEASFMIEANNFVQITNLKKELYSLDNTLKLTFLDNKGLI